MARTKKTMDRDALLFSERCLGLETLEPRILLDAAAVATGAEIASDLAFEASSKFIDELFQDVDIWVGPPQDNDQLSTREWAGEGSPHAKGKIAPVAEVANSFEVGSGKNDLTPISEPFAELPPDAHNLLGLLDLSVTASALIDGLIGNAVSIFDNDDTLIRLDHVAGAEIEADLDLGVILGQNILGPSTYSLSPGWPVAEVGADLAFLTGPVGGFVDLEVRVFDSDGVDITGEVELVWVSADIDAGVDVDLNGPGGAALLSVGADVDVEAGGRLVLRSTTDNIASVELTTRIDVGLGIAVAADVGVRVGGIGFAYADTDGDGLANRLDRDDDNDGLSDTAEGWSGLSLLEGDVQLGLGVSLGLSVTTDTSIQAGTALLTLQTGGFIVTEAQVGAGALVAAELTGEVAVGPGRGTLSVLDVQIDAGDVDALTNPFLRASIAGFSGGLYVEIDGQVILDFDRSAYEGNAALIAAFDLNGSGAWEPGLVEGSPELVLNVETGELQLLVTAVGGARVDILPFLDGAIINPVAGIDLNAGLSFGIALNSTGLLSTIGTVSVQLSSGISLSSTDRDTDGDGVADHLDLDSDNDGLSDLVESGSGGVDADLDGAIDGGADDNDDGMFDAYQGGGTVDPRDTDADGLDDHFDLDSDNDGLGDAIEGHPTIDGSRISAGDDMDGDGVLDPFDGRAGFGGMFTTPVNTDGDGPADYRDLDSDNDGILDRDESGIGIFADGNGDGIGDHPTFEFSYTDADGSLNSSQDLLNFSGDRSEVAFRELNFAPVADLNDNGTTQAIDFDVSAVIRSGPVALVSPDASVFDPDGTQARGLDLSINLATIPDGSDEMLSIADQTIALTVGPTSTQDIEINGRTYTLVVETLGGTTLNISLREAGDQNDGNGLIAFGDLDAALRTLTYDNQAIIPTLGDRSVAVTVIPDQVGAPQSIAAVATISLTNPAPTLDLNGPAVAGSDVALVYVEGEGPTPLFPALTVTDAANDIVSARLDFDGFADDGSESISVAALNFELGTAISYDAQMIGGTSASFVWDGEVLTMVPTNAGDVLDVSDLSAVLQSLQFVALGEILVDDDRSVTVTVTDLHDQSASASAFVTLRPDNDPPVANPADLMADGLDAQPLTSLDLAALFTDPEGDDLTYALDGAPAWISIDPVTGLLTGTPPIDASMGGDDGVYTFTALAEDTSDATAQLTITLTVDNPAPVAIDDMAASVDGQAVVLDLLGNDLDEDPLSVSAINGQALIPNVPIRVDGGAVILTDADEIIFAPDGARDGTVTFDYTLTDADGASDTATVTVDLGAVNRPPIADIDDLSLTGLDAQTLENYNLSARFSDPDGDELSYSVAGAPDWVIIDPISGILSGIPPINASTAVPNGAYAFEVLATDPSGSSAAIDVILQIDNPAPDAVNDDLIGMEDQSINIDLLDNDTDEDAIIVTSIEGQAATFDASIAVDGGEIAIDALGNLTFTPDADRTAPVTFQYTITDADGASDTATATIILDPVDDLPMLELNDNDDLEVRVIQTHEDPPITLLEPHQFITDIDSDTIRGLTLSLSGAYDGVGDEIRLAGVNISVPVTEIVEIDRVFVRIDSDGQTVTLIAIDGDLQIAVANRLLEQLSYVHTADQVTLAERSIDIDLFGPSGAVVDEARIIIELRDPADPPVTDPPDPTPPDPTPPGPTPPGPTPTPEPEPPVDPVPPVEKVDHGPRLTFDFTRSVIDRGTIWERATEGLGDDYGEDDELFPLDESEPRPASTVAIPIPERSLPIVSLLNRQDVNPPHLMIESLSRDGRVMLSLSSRVPAADAVQSWQVAAAEDNAVQNGFDVIGNMVVIDPGLRAQSLDLLMTATFKNATFLTQTISLDRESSLLTAKGRPIVGDVNVAPQPRPNFW